MTNLSKSQIDKNDRDYELASRGIYRWAVRLVKPWNIGATCSISVLKCLTKTHAQGLAAEFKEHGGHVIELRGNER